MKASTQLTSKGQVVIPKQVRDRLRWRTGLLLRVEASTGGLVVLSPESKAQSIDARFNNVSGFLADGDPVSALEAEHRRELEVDAEAVVGSKVVRKRTPKRSP